MVSCEARSNICDSDAVKVGSVLTKGVLSEVFGQHVSRVRQAGDFDHVDHFALDQLLEQSNAPGDVRDLLHRGSVARDSDAHNVVAVHRNGMHSENAERDESKYPSNVD